MKKILLYLFAAAVISNSYTMVVNADWKHLSDQKYEYYNTDGLKYSNGIYKIDNIMYSFNEDGVCTGTYSGWTKLKSDNSKKRYYKDGSCCGGWVIINNKFYYFNDLTGFFTGEIRDQIKNISNVKLSNEDCGAVISFDIENLTNEDILIGDFELEKLIDEKWIKVPLSNNYIRFGDDVMGLLPKVKLSCEMNISEMYEKLNNGTYRIVDGDTSQYGAASNSFEILVDENGDYVLNEL